VRATGTARPVGAVRRGRPADHDVALPGGPGPRSGRLRGGVGVVRGGPRSLLARGLGLLRRALVGRARRLPGRPADAGCGLVPRRAPVLRRARPHGPGQGRRRAGDPAPVRVARARELDVGGAARAGRPDPGGAAGARRGGGRPRLRVPAEPARDRGRVPGHGVPRRGLVLGGARVRRPLGHRPLRPDRAEGPARRRRLPLRRPGLRPVGARRRDPRGRRRQPRPPGLPGRHGLGGRLPGRRAARVRRPSVRPSAVGPVLQRHDGAAEGDRPGPGRDPARAPQAAGPPRRRPPRRPRLLVHHHGLDDVELPRGGAAAGRVHRALRRQPGPPGPHDAVGPGRGGPDHDLRHERRVPGLLPEGRDPARRHARPLRAAGDRLDGLAAVARGLPVGPRRGRRRVAVLHERRHGRLHGVRRRRADPARPPRRAAGAGARLRGGELGRGRPAGGGGGRGARGHQAHAVHASRLLERPRRLALPRGVLRALPRGLAPRGLDRADRARDGDHLRAVGFDDQPRRRADGDRGDLPRRPRRGRRGRRAGGRRAARGGGGVDAAVRGPAPGAGAHRRARGGDPPAGAQRLLAAPRPRRGPAGRAGAADPLGQGPRGPGQADPHGDGAGARGLARVPRGPRGARAVRGARGRAGGRRAGRAAL
ncbi:MAG: Acetoacetyl-CoA synthetase, partial [uncultured Solirubrobacteraceae bacterium]